MKPSPGRVLVARLHTPRVLGDVGKHRECSTKVTTALAREAPSAGHEAPDNHSAALLQACNTHACMHVLAHDM